MNKKKFYFAPEAKAIKLMAEGLIASSADGGTIVIDDNSGEIGTGGEFTQGKSSNSIWD